MLYNYIFSPLELSLTILLSLSFIIYGCLCLFTNHMKKEFKRYGLSKFRKLTGLLELMGGIGVIIGLKYPLFFFISTSGLSLLMLLGIITRIRVQDKIIAIMPAFFYFALSLFLFIYHMFYS